MHAYALLLMDARYDFIYYCRKPERFCLKGYEIKALPIVTNDEELKEHDFECTICMEHIIRHAENTAWTLDDLKNNAIRRLPCKHYFHTGCITKWLKLIDTCPNCRKKVIVSTRETRRRRLCEIF